MKKITYLFLGAMLMMFFACTQEDVQVAQLDDELSCRPKGPVIKVYPTGVDDTENLVQAFAEAKAAGPGAVVQLVEGQYTIGMIEVREFDGYFRGAGKGKTIISNLPELPCEELWLENVMPALLKFIGGDITVSDFTIQLMDGQPCAFGAINESVYGDLNSVLMFNDYSTRFIPEKKHVRAVVKNVDFLAGDDGGYGVYGTKGNMAMTFFCGMDVAFPTGYEPLSSADVTISNCVFVDGLCGPDLFGLDKYSKVKIENNTIQGGFQQVFIGAFYGANVIVKDNKFKAGLGYDLYISENEWTDWYFMDEIPTAQSVYSIIGNDFQSPPDVVGLYIKDFYNTVYPELGLTQIIDIKNNSFKNQEGGIAIMCLNNVDAKVWNNTFKGTGDIGVYVDGEAATMTYAQNNKILSNNFSQSNYTGANVYLGEFTANNLVVGVAKDKVTDLGVDNKAIGVKANKMGPHHRPVIQGNNHSIHARRFGH
jgi:hypothetical protein